MGIKLPIDRITALAHLYGIPIAVDAAQAAGIVPIDLKESGIDFLCCAGHKGLYGPMGTGMLIFNTDIPLIQLLRVVQEVTHILLNSQKYCRIDLRAERKTCQELSD